MQAVTGAAADKVGPGTQAWWLGCQALHGCCPYDPLHCIPLRAGRRGAAAGPRAARRAVRKAGLAQPPALHVCGVSPLPAMQTYLLHTDWSTPPANRSCLLSPSRRPRPVIEEVAVKVDVPAIMMEEAAPQVGTAAPLPQFHHGPAVHAPLCPCCTNSTRLLLCVAVRQRC